MDRGRVRVTSSGLAKGAEDLLVARKRQPCWTKNEPNAWICLDLGRNRRLSPTHYTLCSGASEAGFDHKGGRVALAAVEHLRESARAALRDGNGSDRLHALARASLVCVGAGPPPGVEVPDWVEVAGWCDRSSPAGRAKFADELMGAHFVCIPSRADFYGVTLVEALAHGVPVVARIQIRGI